MRAKGGGDPKTLDGGWSEQKLAVGCEAFGAVEQHDDLGGFQRRHTPDGILHQGREALPIGRQQLVVESAGMPSRDHGAGVRS